jgi:glycosyltransferase involved in cell wall biosynthesis
MRVMRVLTRANVGGPVHHVRFLEEALPREGIRSSLLLGRVERDEGDATGSLASAGIAHRRVPGLRRRIRPLDDARAFLWLFAAFRRERPDVVHTHTGKAGLLGRLAARLAGVPAVVHTHHGHCFHGYYGALRSRLLLAVERFLARRTDVLLVPGDELRRELLALRLAPADRIVAYPPALSLERMPAPPEARRRVRSAFGVAEDEVLVGTLGRLVAVKGVDRLIRAAARAGVKLAVAGEGSEREALERLALALDPAGDRLQLAGPTREPEAFLAALDVFALGSRNEGLPVALLEAMASGLACVVPAAGSIPDVVSDGIDGLLFDPRDDAALARAIHRVARDAELRSRLGAEAARAVRRRVDPDGMTRAVVSAYRSALGAAALPVVAPL